MARGRQASSPLGILEKKKKIKIETRVSGKN
jgi:hypothetical protein